MKKSVKKTLIISAIAVCMGGAIYTLPAQATYPVIDAANLKQNILNVAQTVKIAVNTLTQIDNQVKSLENEAKNLAKMNSANSRNNISLFDSSMDAIKGTLYSSRGLPLRYEAMESKYGQLYKGTGGYAGGTFEEWSQQATALRQQTNNAAYDAMKAQGMIEDIEDDEQGVEDLLANSDSAQGALEAAQVSNHLASVNTRQLMRMQTIQAAAFRLQASEAAEEVQKREIALAENKRGMEGIEGMANPFKTPPKGKGFIQFGGSK
jgi:type IV secretion system protein TrbJ